MLPEIPELNALQRYLVSGWLLNRFRDRLIRTVPLAGNGVDVSEEADGMAISVAASTGTSALDFAGSLSGSSVTVRAGKVLHTDWGTFDPNDPDNDGWTEEAVTVAGSTMTLPDGDTVWLKLTIAATTTDATGPLSSNGTGSVTVTGGGGGGGGAGGGGAGGAGESSSDASNGPAGAAGASGSGGLGASGAGTGGVGGATTPTGDGSVGGTGGAGEDGEPGKYAAILNYTTNQIRMRRWRVTAGSFVVATTKPASSATSAHIRICSRDVSDIVQHQVGSVTLCLPVATFVYPAA